MDAVTQFLVIAGAVFAGQAAFHIWRRAVFHIWRRAVNKGLKGLPLKSSSVDLELEVSVSGMEQFIADLERAEAAIEYLAQSADGITQPVTINNCYYGREGNSESETD